MSQPGSTSRGSFAQTTGAGMVSPAGSRSRSSSSQTERTGASGPSGSDQRERKSRKTEGGSRETMALACSAARRRNDRSTGAAPGASRTSRVP